ncbi:hypothetical protein DEFDS_0508 [Deferribacter desulfuricans SSM1]|uniref:Uncharacterized protein n=1 Tax=Deferribacter desulfuricans (strain DSM 14783 / JCM 11476 / NBRC 101012 / SSM1) TaxID=639282 RepID=D3PBM9_DEFDS|nr:hypothetical protein [Deferribacter desulfuricans]BAI80002.1 hypothetical protein DEFDS_0508 [Deferribacter desulfuricans SSM1]
MKKTDGIDILKELKKKELDAVALAKEGLEDMALFIAEMEKIYKLLNDPSTPYDEKAYLKYKLFVIEQYINKLNALITNLLPIEAKNNTLN